MEDEKQPSKAAMRMRRHRQRQRNGIQVVPVKVNQDMVESLLITRQLTIDEAGDPYAIGAAIERLLKRI